MNTLLPYQTVRKEVDDEHYYYIDDEFVPATTHIIGEAGPVQYGLRNFWKQNTAEDSDRILKETAEFGSYVHSQIEVLLNGIDIPNFNELEPKAKKHLMSFYNWFHEFNPDINSIKSEHVVGSKKYKYGGTIDLFCTKNNENWIVDFKTSSGIYFSHEAQVAAYKNAYEEMYGIKVDHMAILRTGSKHKSGYEFKEIERSFDAFLNIYKTYVDINGGKIPEPPEVDVYPDTLKLYEKNL